MLVIDWRREAQAVGQMLSFFAKPQLTSLGGGVRAMIIKS
jgi:hypothetical protein